MLRQRISNHDWTIVDGSEIQLVPSATHDTGASAAIFSMIGVD